MLLRELTLWFLMASASYSIGPRTLTAQTPVQVAVSGSAGAPAWFSGLLNFFGRGLCCRYSETADSDAIDVQAQSHYRHVVSYDNGQTWPVNYRVKSLHTSNEPLAMVVGSNVISGVLSAPGFARGPMPLPGMAVGGAYSLAPQLPSVRILRSDYVTIQNGGLDYCSSGFAVITGLTRDVAPVPSSPNYYCYWFGDIVQVSATRWISVIEITYVGDGVVRTCECIESTDQGHTWVIVGTVATAAVGGEGYSEPCLTRLASGDLMVISRAGSFSSSSKFYRVSSSDFGRTWGNPTSDRIGAFAKAPKIFQLSGTGDYVLSAGGPGGAADSGHKGHGLYLETDPRNGPWTNVWDLLVHHNAMISDPHQQFDLSGATYSGASGYGGIVELSPNRLLISYDYSRGAYGLASELNRVYVVDVTIA